MKEFLPMLKILLRFVLLYIILVLLYQFYLNNYTSFVADPFTTWSANCVAKLQEFLGYPTTLVDSLENHSIYYFTDVAYTSRMVEGCNGISVAILFVSFVFAFYKGYKTFVFVLVGLLFLFALNILRIAFINIIFLKFPKYDKIAHDYFFPAIIYGGVIILWLIWIRLFSLKKSNEDV